MTDDNTLAKDLADLAARRGGSLVELHHAAGVSFGSLDPQAIRNAQRPSCAPTWSRSGLSWCWPPTAPYRFIDTMPDQRCPAAHGTTLR
jgi:hypothetical protein